MYELAGAIIELHTSTGGSWGYCRECRQAIVGANESFPVWPCDARKLADLVIASEGESVNAMS